MHRELGDQSVTRLRLWCSFSSSIGYLERFLGPYFSAFVQAARTIFISFIPVSVPRCRFPHPLAVSPWTMQTRTPFLPGQNPDWLTIILRIKLSTYLPTFFLRFTAWTGSKTNPNRWFYHVGMYLPETGCLYTYSNFLSLCISLSLKARRNTVFDSPSIKPIADPLFRNSSILRTKLTNDEKLDLTNKLHSEVVKPIRNILRRSFEGLVENILPQP